MTAPLSPACPVCAAPIQASPRGRPAIYCGKPCRQAAHRARGRADHACLQLAWTERRLQAALADLARRLASLATTVGGIARSHQATAADYRHAARIVGITS